MKIEKNPNFTKEITKTPDPTKTSGIFYQKSFIDFEGRYGIKRWHKTIVNNKLKYVFDSIWLLQPLPHKGGRDGKDA